MTDLDRLIDCIDPRNTFDRCDAAANAAVNGIQGELPCPESIREFRALLAEFYCHIENALLRCHPPRSVDYDIDWGRCLEILLEEYGPPGDKAAYRIARTGVEGGLYTVLQAIAARMADQYARSGIESRVIRYWEGLSVSQMIDAGSEFLAKYADCLPGELLDGNAPRVRAMLPTFLQEHPEAVRRLRRPGQ